MAMPMPMGYYGYAYAYGLWLCLWLSANNGVIRYIFMESTTWGKDKGVSYNCTQTQPRPWLETGPRLAWALGKMARLTSNKSYKSDNKTFALLVFTICIIRDSPSSHVSRFSPGLSFNRSSDALSLSFHLAAEAEKVWKNQSPVTVSALTQWLVTTELGHPNSQRVFNRPKKPQIPNLATSFTSPCRIPLAYH